MRPQRLSIKVISLLAISMAAQSPDVNGGPPPPPTNVLYGFLNSNRTLTVTNPGPIYYIVGDVIVQPSVTLTVEPGVHIIFTANRDTLQGGDYSNLSELVIRGNLIATSVSDSIRFVSTQLGNNEWGQIKIDTGAQATFNRVSIRGAVNAINSLGSVVVTNASIVGSNVGVYGIGGTVLADAHISGMVTSVAVEGAGQVFRVLVSNGFDGLSLPFMNGPVTQCVLSGRSNGLGAGLVLGPGVNSASPDSTDPRPTIVSGFGTGVILSTGATAKHLLVYGNGIGMEGTGPNGLVHYCTVANNAGAGVKLRTNSRVYSSLITQNGGPGLSDPSGCGTVYGNYLDTWANSPNSSCMVFGASVAAFNPFYLNPGLGDYHLSSGSIFKTYGPWGAEIGAYGPGPGQPVPADKTSWGRVKATYR